jgi:hypothetical protein
MTLLFPYFTKTAPFRCNQGCGTFERRRCVAGPKGMMVCPKCRKDGTLEYVSESNPSEGKRDAE